MLYASVKNSDASFRKISLALRRQPFSAACYVARRVMEADGGSYRLVVLPERWHRIGPDAMALIQPALSAMAE